MDASAKPVSATNSPLHPTVRVTISDVAKALGVTKSTVSRALNGYTDISPTTRHRIRRAAAEMGYRPLSHAQAIRTGRTRSLGLVLQTDAPGGGRPFLADFIAGITSETQSENWTLTVATSTGGQEMLATMARLIEERKADGFVLPRTLVQDDRISLLRHHRVPFILYGRTEQDDDCAWFDIAGEDAMRSAVLRLARLGHRRIGFVNGEHTYYLSRLREVGFRAGLAEADLPVETQLITDGAMTEETGRQAALRLLRLKNAPTALVFAVDSAALGGYGAVAELGLGVGTDVSVIGYDGIPEGAYATPALTTYQVDTRAAGRRLAHLLIRHIRGEPAKALRELAPANLVARASDGPPPPIRST